ncbi:MAG: transcription-repair coupling factor [Nitrospinota bacterium]|nr:transcription-repair coupling factor [Nitrospinota bacterium]
MFKIREKIDSGLDKIAVAGLTSSSKGYFVSAVSEEVSRPILLVASDRIRGEKLYTDISFFNSLLRPHSENKIYFLPSWEILPYEPLSPHPDISGERLDVMEALINRPESFILITTIEALRHRVIPKDILAQSLINIAKGGIVDMDTLLNRGISLGYKVEELVENKGDISVRGGILDIFPANSPIPYRIEFMGDEVETIREFSPSNQRSIREVSTITIPPAREVVLGKRELLAGVKRIEERLDRSEIFDEKREDIHLFLSKLKEGILPPYIEHFISDFYGRTDTIFNYIPKETLFILDEPEEIDKKNETFNELIDEGFRNSLERGEIFPPPEELYLREDDLKGRLRSSQQIDIRELHLLSREDSAPIKIGSPGSFMGRFDFFIKELSSWRDRDYKVIISADNGGQAKRILELLNENGVDGKIANKVPKNLPPLTIFTGELSQGTIIEEAKLVFISHEDIFGSAKRLKKRTKTNRDTFSTNLHSIKEGDFLVHRDYGIGLYRGIKELKVEGEIEEFVAIEYAENRKLYLPMDRLGGLEKFVGGEANPPLSKLGGNEWEKKKKMVKKGLMDMASKLMRINAARKLVEGIQFSKDGHFHEEFAESFEYDETDDQLRAIKDVTEDMEGDRPMDRLICGDVGYGKTEVAMRAAFKAAFDGKQVAVMVPTTLLAQQHYKLFTSRFAPFPIRVDILTRAKGPREEKSTIKGLADGSIDIIIGTHRLIQKDIIFKDLGLLIIDEEQHFGVAHKEKLKEMRSRIDILSLSATPIPRTLHFALMGVRDMSIIDTPPQNRLAIKTFVSHFDEALIKQAIEREMDRGGQIFFVHNRIETIYTVYESIKKILPKARIAVGHGRMNPKELNLVMTDFLSGATDILLSTTIVESGLDIPMANTIIIDQANKFGLAQLYQLRGRVGRARHQAYAYLIISEGTSISDSASRRLAAIEELSELGSGFKIAARDLEIRGGGNMMGKEQSGYIASIGFDLYCSMLEDAVKELQGEEIEDDFTSSVKTSYRGFIPNGYISNLGQRLDIYKRLDLLSEEDSLDGIGEEIVDRYGDMPEEVVKLISVTRLRILCKKAKIERGEPCQDGFELTFSDKTAIDTSKLLNYIGKGEGILRLVAGNKIKIATKGDNWRDRFSDIEKSLRLLLSMC